MADEALERVKQSLDALESAYRDAGGELTSDPHHNPCPICHDDTGFQLGLGQDGFARWGCYSGKNEKCRIPPGQKTRGTIVDLLMAVHGYDQAKACDQAKAKYGGGTAAGGRKERPARKQGKLHLTVDAAIDAAKFGVQCRDKHDKKSGKRVKVYSGVTLARYWKYESAKGEPVFAAARFDCVRVKDGKQEKQFAPVHRDGNGWRVGLGSWGTKKQPCPLYNLPALLKALEIQGGKSK